MFKNTTRTTPIRTSIWVTSCLSLVKACFILTKGPVKRRAKKYFSNFTCSSFHMIKVEPVDLWFKDLFSWLFGILLVLLNHWFIIHLLYLHLSCLFLFHPSELLQFQVLQWSKNSTALFVSFLVGATKEEMKTKKFLWPITRHTVKSSNGGGNQSELDSKFIIWLNLWVGKIKQIVYSDWLCEHNCLLWSDKEKKSFLDHMQGSYPFFNKTSGTF